MRLNLRAITVCLLSAVAGCHSNSTRQAFLAEDPDSGERAMYCIQVRTESGWDNNYQISAGYLPRTAIDVYEGKLPDSLAELASEYTPSPDDAAAALIRSNLNSALVRQSELVTATANDKALTPAELQQLQLDIGGLVAAARTDLPTLQSMHEAGSTDPYRYGKLTYLISTKTVSFRNVDQDVVAVQNSARSLATSLDRAVGGPETQNGIYTSRLEQLHAFLKAHPDPKTYTSDQWQELEFRLQGLRR